MDPCKHCLERREKEKRMARREKNREWQGGGKKREKENAMK